MRVHDALSRNLADISARLHEITRRANLHGSVTLTANQASTTVTQVGLTPDSKIFFEARTSNGAAALATTYVADADRAAGSFIITHANNAQTDRHLNWRAVGD